MFDRLSMMLLKRLSILGFTLGIIGLSGSLGFSQTPTRLWEIFSKTRFQERFNKTHGLYFYYPQFSPELLALQGKSVELQGFFIPLDTSPSKTLILSKYPMAECFFCGGAGPETIAVAYLKNPPSRRLKLDQIIKVRGILQLNADDVEEMTFILQNAEIIS
ncbi:hypothetical protein CLV31_102416 [Algoriphagus aquaeductus]|uniref:DUF3299 domain-containing protein n=2 Tax=Algoriphagus aquaeductus TaxID=475299 RepID=A0A326RWA8_9BACT|nr:hypothetical protein CLV31_102416 [Algoriphagus aquaeductus]